MMLAATFSTGFVAFKCQMVGVAGGKVMESFL